MSIRKRMTKQNKPKKTPCCGILRHSLGFGTTAPPSTTYTNAVDEVHHLQSHLPPRSGETRCPLLPNPALTPEGDHAEGQAPRDLHPTGASRGERSSVSPTEGTHTCSVAGQAPRPGQGPTHKFPGPLPVLWPDLLAPGVDTQRNSLPG